MLPVSHQINCPGCHSLATVCMPDEAATALQGLAVGAACTADHAYNAPRTAAMHAAVICSTYANSQ